MPTFQKLISVGINGPLSAFSLITITWIPAHSRYLANEIADSLAKRGANNTIATLLKMPILKVTWDVAIGKRTKYNILTK